jgi:predicted nucleic acid-binding protein
MQRRPDVFVGAHAAVRGGPLLTRDARRYRRYFPTLELISPRSVSAPLCCSRHISA